MSVYKEGNFVVLTHGEYSDYSFTGVVKVIKEYDSSKLIPMFHETLRAKGWKEEFPGDNYTDWIDETGCMIYKYSISDQFDAWFINESGLVEEVEHDEMHTGCYGHLEIQE